MFAAQKYSKRWMSTTDMIEYAYSVQICQMKNVRANYLISMAVIVLMFNWRYDILCWTVAVVQSSYKTRHVVDFIAGRTTSAGTEQRLLPARAVSVVSFHW